MFYILGVLALALAGELENTNFKKKAVHFDVGERHDDLSLIHI